MYGLIADSFLNEIKYTAHSQAKDINRHSSENLADIIVILRRHKTFVGEGWGVPNTAYGGRATKSVMDSFKGFCARLGYKSRRHDSGENL